LGVPAPDHIFHAGFLERVPAETHIAAREDDQLGTLEEGAVVWAERRIDDAGQPARQFADIFTKMLTELQKTFPPDQEADQEAFGSARDLMSNLNSAGRKLCATEVLVNGQPTGRNAGPTWEFLPPNG
jgi:hypothetical protein